MTDGVKAPDAPKGDLVREVISETRLSRVYSAAEFEGLILQDMLSRGGVPGWKAETASISVFHEPNDALIVRVFIPSLGY